VAATVSILGTATFNTNSGTKTVTATPAVGDLIVIVTANSGSTGTTFAPTDNNSGGAGTYTLINTAVKATSADTMQIWVRTALITSATSTVFTQAPGTTTGGGLVVLDVQGMDKTGATAVVRSAIQSNQAAGGTPAPVLGATPSSLNAIIGAVFNATNPATMTQRSGYSEIADLGYNTPATGLEVMSRNSGETSATITWGSTSASAFASIAIELDTRVTHATTGSLTGPGSTVSGSAVHQALHTTSGTPTGPGASIVGSASNFTIHSTSGDLPGLTAQIVGAADHQSLVIPHVASGTLTGPGTSLSGSSTRYRAFGTSGTLTGQGSSLSGSADREAVLVPHDSSGTLTGPGSTVAGSASRLHAFGSSGTLTGQGSSVVGSSTRIRAFATSGDLAGPGATVTGAADREGLTIPHEATGAIVGPGSEVWGQAENDMPEPLLVDADVGAEKRRIKKRDANLKKFKQEQKALREQIEKAVNPVVQKAEPVVVQESNGKVEVLSVNAPTIEISVPPAFDVQEVARLVSETLNAARIEAQRVKNYQDAVRALAHAKQEVARIIKRKQDDEFLLLM
jgi:hypothetical protein